MRKLLLRWLIDAVAVYAAIYWVPGIEAADGIAVYFWIALILGLVNAIIGPLIKFLTCPLIILSLGVFTLVINGLLLMLTSALARQFGIAFVVNGFGPAFLGALVISIVSFGLSVLTGANRKDRRRR